MRPWICVAYSAPVAAAMAVFLIYPIGQGSFSDGMPLGKNPFAHPFCKDRDRTYLNGKSLQNMVGQSPYPEAASAVSDYNPSHALNTNTGGDLIEDNSVLNLIRPRKLPGLYQIICQKNKFKYIGESTNVSGRLSSHKSVLNRSKHSNSALQHQ
jgi:hypothetical protein